MWHPNPGETLNDSFTFVKKTIQDTSWNDFARSPSGLDLGNEIDEIIHDHSRNRGEQKRRMLLKWQENNGPNAKVDSLYKCVNIFLKLDDSATSKKASFRTNSQNGGGDQDGRGPPPMQPLSRGEQSRSDVQGMSPEVPFTERKKIFSESAETKTMVTHLKTEKNESDGSEYSSSEEEERNNAGASRPTTDAGGFQGGFRKWSSKKKTKTNTDASGSSGAASTPRTAFNFCDKFVPEIPPASQDSFDTHLKEPTIYPIRNNPKGCILITNNKFAGEGRRERKGSEVDINNMETLWRGLGCDLYGGETQRDKSAGEMKDLFRNMTRLEKGKYDFIAIVIMTHGAILDNQEVFYGNDPEPDPIFVQDVLMLFSNSVAENLQNVPKLFFLQFCRGKKTDRGLAVDSDPHDPGDTEVPGMRIPTISDILVAYPTHFGHTAIRNEKYGSWYINAITNVFTRFAGREHLVDMLTRVNDSMASMTDEMDDRKGTFQCKAMSNFQSSLRRKLYFFPGFPKST